MLAGVFSGRYWREPIDPTSEMRRTLDVPSPKSLPHVIEFASIVKRQIRCPAAFAFNEVDLHLGDQVALSYELLRSLGTHICLFSHVSSHSAGSGR